jgi:hypothetical protein
MFFFRGDSGAVVFFTTPSLSQKAAVDSSKGMPIILSLYRRPSIMSTAIRNATNSEPNVDDSTVFCLLECHKIGALFTKMITRVWDCRVNRHPAWSESTKQEVTTKTPLGSGES